MNKSFLVLLFFILTAGMALGTTQLRSAGYWSGFGNYEECLNHNPYETTLFSSQVTSSNIAYGSPFQVLTGKIGTSGYKTAVFSGGGYLWEYSLIGGNMFLINQVTLPEAQTKQAVLINSSGQIQVIVPGRSTLYTYKLNASGFHLVKSYNTTANNGTISTGLVCTSTLDHAVNGDVCFYGSSNGRYFEYYPKSNVTYSIHIGGRPSGVPAFSANFNGARVAIINNGTSVSSVKVVVPISRYLERNITGQTKTWMVGFYNVNGAGFDELVVAGTSASASYLTIFDSNGASFWSKTIHDYSGGSVGYAGFATGGFTRFAVPQIAAFSYNAFASVGLGGYELAVYNGSNGGVEWSFKGANLSNTKRITTGNIIGVDVNYDELTDIITPFQVITPAGSVPNVYYNLSGSTGGWLSLGDVNADFKLELIGGSNGATWIKAGNTTGAGSVTSPKVVLSGRDFDRNYANPVCLGSSVKFVARDCLDTPVMELCNYLNNRSTIASEFLYTDCGIVGGPIVSGAAYSSGIEVSCYYNVSGIYAAKVYVGDSFYGVNVADPWIVASIDVRNLTPGISCNGVPYVGVRTIFSSAFTNDTPDSSGVTQSFKNQAVEVLTGGGSFPSLIVGLFLVAIAFIGGMYGTYRAGIKEPGIALAAGSVIAFAVFILLTTIGMLPVWILLIFILGAVLFFSLKAYRTFTGG
jgi:hypothetical protein